MSDSNTIFWHSETFKLIKEIHDLKQHGCKNIHVILKTTNDPWKDYFLSTQAYFAHCLLNFSSLTLPKLAEDFPKIQTEEIFRIEGHIDGTKDPLKGCYWLLDSSTETPEPGVWPYLSGPYTGLYSIKPWTIRQYAGFSSAQESNNFYRDNLKKGQMGLSIAFDLPTHRGFDSDHPRVSGDIGMAGVAIDSILDMRVLFDQIPLNKMSVSMTMNGAVLPIMALYLAVAKEQGADWKDLSGTIQNDILKEFMVRNTFIYPPNASMRIIGDIMAFTSQNVPKFNPISISGYHIQEAGANPELELGLTLADAIEYVRTGIKNGLDVDDFAPRLSFFFGIGMDYFTEVAKLRAARVLWAKLMKKHFNPKNPKSSILRTHCQTSGWSLTAKNIYNNLSRTMLEAMAAIHGGTQSLHTNSYDEALALPCEFSAKLARDTQLFLQNDTDIRDKNYIDPWFGSEYVEKLTKDIEAKALAIIEEMEKLGGMAKAIELGIPQQKIELAAAITQARIDSGDYKIIGNNEQETISSILTLDPEKNRNHQIELLKELKKQRDPQKVKESIQEIENAAKNPHQNLLEVMVRAAQNYLSVGEMTQALETVFGRYDKQSKSINGVYLNTMKKHYDQKDLNNIINKVLKFESVNGRRPRILLVKMGQDGHDRGIKVIASAFSDFGFDVDIGPLFSTPIEVAKQAIENDVHIIGVSSLSGGHKILIPELIKELKTYNKKENIYIALGGIIPARDELELKKIGVHAIFGPGTPIIDSINHLLNLLIH